MTSSPDSGDLVAPDPKIAVPEEVAEAVRTLIRWAGDDPDREGLLDTPARVARAWKEYARGYERGSARSPRAAPSTRSAAMTRSCCCAIFRSSRTANIIWRRSSARPRSPICRATAWSEYPSLPECSTVSRGALQVQERLTAQVADCICEHLQPKGVAVVIEASHACMTARGVGTPGVMMTTSRMMGIVPRATNGRGAKCLL